MKGQTDSRDRQVVFWKAMIAEFRSQERERNTLKEKEKINQEPEGPPQSQLLPPILTRLKVCVRVRPMNQTELNAAHDFDIVTCKTNSYPNAFIHLHEPRVRFDLTSEIQTHRFLYDHIFDEKATNFDIFEEIASPLVTSFLQGGRSTLFAFGQTGSGKTHSLFGTLYITWSINQSQIRK